eukprot:TRINITY_DN51030_c0_g1_i1.p1 TRINITY_DN51030_c0_g1~~TRINITY_DN51030_c0_g1_i1.p1  ORF type:complete len:103 (-),score=36.05 TRINITY_DN51030_c0_g1_i1:35-307(-)
MLRSLVGSEMCIRDRGSYARIEEQLVACKKDNGQLAQEITTLKRLSSVQQNRIATGNAELDELHKKFRQLEQLSEPVSYTHLTLPTKRKV